MIRLLLIFIVYLAFTSSSFAEIPKVKEFKTPNNLTVWSIQDNYLPIVSIKLAFKKAGFAHDPIDKKGLSFLVSSLLDEGAGKLSSLEFKKKLEELAVELSFSVDEDNFYISMKTLTKNLDEAIKLMGLALTSPTFSNKAINRIRGQIYILITKQEEDPNNLALTKLNEAIYKNHSYSFPKYGTKDTLAPITSIDLNNFIKNNFTKQNLAISVVGDFNQNELSKILDTHLSDLADVYIAPKELTTPDIKNTNQVLHIKKNMPQSIAILGQKGLKRNDPHFYPLFILNHILGGGSFESRLMTNIREKRGLAYSVYSYLSLTNKTGLLIGHVATKSKDIKESVNLIKKTMANLRDKGILSKELEDTKDYLINSFPLKMTSNSNLANFLIHMQLDDLGINFLENRNNIIKDVSIEEINRIAYELLDPEKLTIVVVGPHSI